MLVRGRTWYLYVLLYLVGYRPTVVCTVFFMGGLIRQGPYHGVACKICIVWCIWAVLWKLRCASNVIFSCPLVNLTVLREVCAHQTHPMGFVKSTHPTRGVLVRHTDPSRVPQDILMDRVQGTK